MSHSLPRPPFQFANTSTEEDVFTAIKSKFPCLQLVPVVPHPFKLLLWEELVPASLQPRTGHGGHSWIPLLPCSPPGWTDLLFLHLSFPPVHSFERVHKAKCLTSNVQMQCPRYPPAISHLQETIINGSRAVTPQQPIPAAESNHAFGWLRKYFLPAFSNRKRRKRNEENKCSLFQVFSLSELVTELSIILVCFMFCDKIWVKGNKLSFVNCVTCLQYAVRTGIIEFLLSYLANRCAHNRKVLLQYILSMVMIPAKCGFLLVILQNIEKEVKEGMLWMYHLCPGKLVKDVCLYNCF